MALSFDDGPSNYTNGVLSVLKRNAVPATFFVVGASARNSPATLRKIRRRGHVLGNHSYSHPKLDLMPHQRIRSELRDTNRVIRSATGFTPCVFRAPYGRDPKHVVDVARSTGLMSVNWSVDPRDWARPGESRIVKRVVDQVRPGSIILLHDGGGNRNQTVEALTRIVKILRNRGYRFMNVPDILNLNTSYR